MSKNSKDLLISLVCIVFATVFLFVVIPLQIPLPRFSSGGTTPRVIPRICCILILVMSALMLIRTMLNDRACFSVFAREFSITIRNKRGWRTLGYVMLVFALSVIYYIGYISAGFIITTLIVFPMYAFVLGCRKPLAIIITDVVLTFGLYYSFAIFMSCYLPGWAPF